MYAELLDEWFEKEKRKGLVDFKIVLNPCCSTTSTVEEVCEEILKVINAPKIPLDEI